MFLSVDIRTNSIKIVGLLIWTQRLHCTDLEGLSLTLIKRVHHFFNVFVALLKVVSSRRWRTLIFIAVDWVNKSASIIALFSTWATLMCLKSFDSWHLWRTIQHIRVYNRHKAFSSTTLHTTSLLLKLLLLRFNFFIRSPHFKGFRCVCSLLSFIFKRWFICLFLLESLWIKIDICGYTRWKSTSLLDILQ